MPVDAPLLEVRNLTVRYPAPSGGRRAGFGDSDRTAVDGVSLTIAAGRTLGLVGESGCGKTSLARGILRLTPVAAGQVLLDGVDVWTARGAALKELRRRMQMVFQDPQSSLNPRHTVESIVREGLDVLGIGPAQGRRERVLEMLERVGLSADHLVRYPGELSGGQRQRVAIARALVLRPSLLVLDEPVSALDVSVQSQVVNLLISLQQEFKLTYLFIGHHLGLVRYISDEIAVMLSGRIVESGPSDAVIDTARHPYTQTLVAAVLEPDPGCVISTAFEGAQERPKTVLNGRDFRA
jgi:ABC-type glutathione transport system ATPase component